MKTSALQHYLGVKIQGGMKRSVHISGSTAKPTRHFRHLRRSHKIGKKKTKETAYKARVGPILEYAGIAWDSHTENEVSAIEIQVKSRAA